MKIQVLVDNPNSWIVPYAKALIEKINEEFKYEAKLLFKHKDVERGDILCLLSCERIFKQLEFNKYNLVVHESDLPKGKGWSPVTWQILEGKKKIPVTLFEAANDVDSGQIYAKKHIEFQGHELLPEIKHQQGIITNELIIDFLRNYPQIGIEQKGEESFYPRRTAKDSELDLNKTLGEQFDLLRVCDNERYPAFFYKNGYKYSIKIEKEDE